MVLVRALWSSLLLLLLLVLVEISAEVLKFKLREL